MAIELEKLLFSVDTGQLKDALDKIDAISSSVSKLANATDKLNKTTEDEVKTKKKKTKATEEAASAEEKLAKAEEEATSKLSAKEKLLQKTSDKVQLLRNQTIEVANSTFKFDSALTTSQASLAAQLKIIGGGIDDFKLLNVQLKNLNSFANTNPFDKAVDGVQSLKRQIRDLNLLDEFKGLGLASEQIKALSRDIEKIKQTGAAANLPQAQISAEIERVKKETIALANEVNTRNAQAKEIERIAKEKARVEAAALAARQSYKNAEEAVSKEILGSMKQYYQQMEAADREAENARKDSFSRMVQIHEWKQQQDEQNYRQDMQNMRKYYQAMEREASSAMQVIKQEQDALAKEQLHGKYMQAGYSSRTAGVAAGLEMKGVPQDVINSYLREAKANEEASRAYRDKVTAIRALQSAEERATHALDALNNETSEGTKLNERSALAVAAYERNLRLAGVSAEDAAHKLRVFKDQQSKITEATSRNQMNYLARGIGVQMGDIGVSLAGGMNPLLVAVQQGSQVQQLIQMANVDAKDMQKVMGESVRQMVESFKLMGVAVGSFVMGGLRSFVEVISEATSASKTFAAMSFYVAEAYGENSAMFSALQGFGKLINSLALAIVGFGTALAVGLVTSIVQTSKAMDTLNESLVLNGALLGATNKELGDLSRAYGSAAASSNDLKLFYAELAKAGFTSKEQLDQVTESSIKLSKYSSLSLEEIAKAYGDLAKDPVKALEKLAIETGLVNVQTIDNIRELKEQGKAFEANKAAIDAMQNAHSKAADTIKEELSAIGLLGKEMAGVWNSIGTAMERVANSKSSKELTSVLSLGSAVIGASISKLGATDAEKKKIDEELEKTVKLIEQTRDGVKGLSSEETERRKAQAEQAKFSKEFHDTEMKGIKKELEETKALTKTKADYIQEGFKKFSEKAKQAGYVTSLAEEQAKVKELSKAWDDANKVTKDKNNADTEANRIKQFLASSEEALLRIRAEAEGKVERLTKAEIELDRIRRSDFWKKLNPEEQKRLELLQKQATQAEILAQAEKMRIDTLREYAELNKQLSQQEIELDRRNSTIENEVRILGLVGVERERATREIELQNKLIQAQARLEQNSAEAVRRYLKRREEIDREAFSGTDKATIEAYHAQNAQEYYNAMKTAIDLKNKEEVVAGKEVNKSIAESYYKEMQRVSDMLADVLITALTEGGKAGSKKLGDYLKRELLNAANMFISQMIRAQLGNFMQSAFGINAGNYSGGTLAGNLVQSVQGMPSFGGMNSVGSGFTNFAMSSFGQKLGLSETVSGVGRMGLQATTLTDLGQTIQEGADLVGKYGGYLNSAYQLSQGRYGAAAGSAIGTYFGGPIGSFVGSQIGGMLDTAFGSSGAPKVNVGGGANIAGGKLSYNLDNTPHWENSYQNNQQLATSVISDQLVQALQKINSNYSGGAFVKGHLNIEGKSSNQMLAQATGSSGSPIYHFFQEAGKGIEDFNKFVAQEIPKLQLALLVDSMRSSSEDYKAIANSLVGDSENLTNTFKDMSAEGVQQLQASLSAAIGTFEQAKLIFSELGQNLNAETLVSLSKTVGGFDNLNSALSSYYSNYFTEEEKSLNLRKQIQDQLSKVNITMPSTREEFRKLVQSLDLSSESGRNAFVALMQVQGAFAELTPVLENTKNVLEERKNLEREYLAAIGDTAALRQLELADLDPSNRAIKERIYAVEDAKVAFEKANQRLDSVFNKLKETLTSRIQELEKTFSATDNAFQRLMSSISSEIDKLSAVSEDTNKSFDMLSEAISKQKQDKENELNTLRSTKEQLSSLIDSLTSSIRELRGEVEPVNKMLVQEARGIIASASSSGVSSDLLLEAVNVVKSSVTTDIYRTKEDQQRAYLLLSNDLETLNNINKDNLSTAEQQILLLETQIKSLDDILESNKKVIDSIRGVDTSVLNVDVAIAKLRDSVAKESQAKQQIEELKKTQALAQQQLDSIRGVDGSILSVKDALSLFQEAAAKEQTAREQINVLNQQLSTAQQQYESAKQQIDAITGLGDRFDASLDELSKAIQEAINAAIAIATKQPVKPIVPTTPNATAGAGQSNQQGLNATVNEYMQKYGGEAYYVVKGINDYQAKMETATNIAKLSGTDVNETFKNTFGMTPQDWKTIESAWYAGLVPTITNPSGSVNTSIGSTYSNAQYETAGSSAGSSAVSSGSSSIDAVYQSVLGRDADPGGAAYWASTGLSGSELTSAIREAAIQAGEIPKYANGGMYQGGLALVGEQGPELINFNKPGMVYNANQTADILSGDSSLSDKVERLAEAVEMLRYEARATAVNTSKMAKQLDRTSDQGDTLRVTVVA